MLQFRKLAALSISASILLSSPSHAADIKPYINIGAGLVDAENRTDFNGVSSGVLRGGIEISPHFAVEAEGQIGLGEKSRDDVFSDVIFDNTRVKLDHQFGAYAVGRLPLSEAASLHARAGYATYQSTISSDQFFEGARVNSFEDTIKLSGVSLGLGGQYMFGEDRLNGIRFDSFIIIDVDESSDGDTSLPDVNGTSGISLTFVRKF